MAMVVVRASIVIVVSNRLIFVFLSFVLCKDSANERHENLFSDGRVQSILCKDSANERHENLFSDGRVQPILCKDSANERHENLFSDGRMQPILCKVTAFLPTIAFRSGVKMQCAPVFHLNI